MKSKATPCRVVREFSVEVEKIRPARSSIQSLFDHAQKYSKEHVLYRYCSDPSCVNVRQAIKDGIVTAEQLWGKEPLWADSVKFLTIRGKTFQIKTRVRLNP